MIEENKESVRTIEFSEADLRALGVSEADLREVERVHRLSSNRLAAHGGSSYEAFRSMETGLSPDALSLWWLELPATQVFGDLSGEAFGSAVALAMMVVEADRALRQKRRLHRALR